MSIIDKIKEIINRYKIQGSFMQSLIDSYDVLASLGFASRPKIEDITETEKRAIEEKGIDPDDLLGDGNPLDISMSEGLKHHMDVAKIRRDSKSLQKYIVEDSIIFSGRVFPKDFTEFIISGGINGEAFSLVKEIANVFGYGQTLTLELTNTGGKHDLIEKEIYFSEANIPHLLGLLSKKEILNLNEDEISVLTSKIYSELKKGKKLGYFDLLSSSFDKNAFIDSSESETKAIKDNIVKIALKKAILILFLNSLATAYETGDSLLVTLYEGIGRNRGDFMILSMLPNRYGFVGIVFGEEKGGYSYYPKSVRFEKEIGKRGNKIFTSDGEFENKGVFSLKITEPPKRSSNQSNKSKTLKRPSENRNQPNT